MLVQGEVVVQTHPRDRDMRPFDKERFCSTRFPCPIRFIEHGMVWRHQMIGTTTRHLVHGTGIRIYELLDGRGICYRSRRGIEGGEPCPSVHLIDALPPLCGQYLGIFAQTVGTNHACQGQRVMDGWLALRKVLLALSLSV